MELNKVILEFIGKSKGTIIAQRLLKKIIRLGIISREGDMVYQILTDVNREHRNRPMCACDFEI